MTASIEPTHAQTGGRRRGFGWLTVLLVAAAGVYCGARWHASIGPRLGMHAAKSDAADDHEHRGSAELWTCSMHPQVIQDQPGLCPICHMQLTPLNVDEHDAPQTAATADSKTGSRLVIDPAVVQNMGVRVAIVTEGPLQRSLRLVGFLDEAQPNTSEINLLVSGWVRRLYAGTEGQHVEAGEPLFDLYSPELQLGVEELIAARRARAANLAGGEGAISATASTLYSAAARKLELLGLDPRQIEILGKLDQAPATITFTSPVTGHVTEKPIVEGAGVKAGDRVLRIVDHSTLWLDAQVFEKDLLFVALGQRVTAAIASRPDDTVSGEIIFIHPHVDIATRTALVRVSIPNPSLELKPGMYATVRLESRIKERAVLAPREAIIDAGDRKMAFVTKAVGHFEPRDVKTGLAGTDGNIEILEGLAAGETVVTSGQFLLDSESRLREAVQKYLNEKRRLEARTADVPPAPEHQGKADAVVAAYLELSAALGEEQTSPEPFDAGTLIDAAHALHGALSGSPEESTALELATAAEALRGVALDRQREAFKTLSAKVIALVEATPPSAAVGETLYRMECPMIDGDWLQTTPEVANPFYGSEMKQCGSLVSAIPLRGE
jgi:Cu(I)/Ag(I) efflux system membrane fusion protein